MSTSTTSTPVSAARPPVAPAGQVKRPRNHGADAKRTVIGAALTAAAVSELGSIAARRAFVITWAEKVMRSERTIISWLREALASLPAPLVDLEPGLELQPQAAPTADSVCIGDAVGDTVGEVEAMPDGKVPELVKIQPPENATPVYAATVPLHLPPGEREVWWSVSALGETFDAAFDLSRCQVPMRTMMRVRQGGQFMQVEMMRTDGVLLVLAHNLVLAGAVHWFGELVRAEYAMRFEVEEKRLSMATTPSLTTPGGTEVLVIMAPGGVRIDAADAFAAFFGGDETAHERFGIAPELRPSELFMLLMPILAEAKPDDRPMLGDLVKWLGSSALPLAAAMDRAAGHPLG